MKIEMKQLKKVTIIDFAEEHDLTLIVEELPIKTDLKNVLSNYMVYFANIEGKNERRIFAYGKSIDDALHDLAKRINNKEIFKIKEAGEGTRMATSIKVPFLQP